MSRAVSTCARISNTRSIRVNRLFSAIDEPASMTPALCGWQTIPSLFEDVIGVLADPASGSDASSVGHVSKDRR